MNKKLNISNDIFIRTTDAVHIETAKKVWQLAFDANDIYLDTYSGWYNVREEQFVTEINAIKDEYLDKISGAPLIKYSQESYFFRLSKYQAKIIEHINSNPNFILPLEHREEILKRLKEEPLTDLSISRHTSITNWGIEIDGTDHVMYVWFDALTNYLSAVQSWNELNAHDKVDREFVKTNSQVQIGTEFNNYITNILWPASIHFIGKDIIWFHAVIWPAMLMSIGLALPCPQSGRLDWEPQAVAQVLPKTILAHGFINDSNGQKMSKSLGNVIDPIELMTKYDPDILRIYFANQTNIGSDLNMNEADLINFYDYHLVAKFSNLVNRSLVLTTKLCNQTIPNTDAIELFSIPNLIKTISELPCP